MKSEVFYITEYTKIPRFYSHVIRAASLINKVIVARNPHAIEDGLYIFGEDDNRREFIRGLKRFIKKVESHSNKGIHKKVAELDIAVRESISENFTKHQIFELKQYHRELMAEFKSTNKKIYKVYYGFKF